MKRPPAGEGPSRRRFKSKTSGRVRSRALQIIYGPTPIHWISDSIARVPSETVGARFYTVNLRRNTCECPGWRKRKTQCKHLYAAAEERRLLTGVPAAPQRRRYKNPRYYDRLRRVRKPCVLEMLRCVGVWVNNG